MAQVRKILREMASTSPGPFDYIAFKWHLDRVDLEKIQRTYLNQRLDLLESFLDLGGGEDGVASSRAFETRGITIVDLSCPFVDPNTACLLFNIALGLFLEKDPTRGKLICVDEAHKVSFTTTPNYLRLTPKPKICFPRRNYETFNQQRLIKTVLVHDRYTGRQGSDRVSPDRDSAATTLRRTRSHLHPGANNISACD
jgi:hypothetical protein